MTVNGLFSKQSTADIFDGRLTSSGEVSVFSCPILKTHHVCVMSDRTPYGRAYNQSVFTVLKDWIHNVLLPPSEPYTFDSMTDKIAESATQLLKQRGYLNNVAAIVPKRKDGEVIFVPKKADPRKTITMTAMSNMDKFYSNLNNFKPTVRYDIASEPCSVLSTQSNSYNFVILHLQYSSRRYKSRAGTDCYLVQIEAPGVSEIKVESFNISMSGCWTIEVSGRKSGSGNDVLAVLKSEFEGYERLLPAEEQEPDETVEPTKDTCRYGEFHEQFQIEHKYKMPPVVKVGADNGIFYLLFEEKETEKGEET